MSALTPLTTDAVPAHERVGYWGDLVQRSFGRLRSRTYGDACFRGEIRRFQLGELRLCRLEASPHRVERTPGARGASDRGQACRSITSILFGAGFSSAAHFSRMFRSRYGASPREWRALGGAVPHSPAKE